MNTYVPRDEICGHLKSSDFLINRIKSLALTNLPNPESASEFKNFEDVHGLFKGEQILKFPPPHIIKGTLHIFIQLLVINMTLKKFTSYI